MIKIDRVTQYPHQHKSFGFFIDYDGECSRYIWTKTGNELGVNSIPGRNIFSHYLTGWEGVAIPQAPGVSCRYRPFSLLDHFSGKKVFMSYLY